jgi:hypothetical protein
MKEAENVEDSLRLAFMSKLLPDWFGSSLKKPFRNRRTFTCSAQGINDFWPQLLQH